MKNLPIKHLQYAKSYAFFIWICESINGLTFKVSMFENRGIFEKFSNEKSLQDSRNRIFRIVRYRRICSESESGIRTTLLVARSSSIRIFLPPLPLTLSRFLDLCSLDPVYRIYFSTHCAHGLVVHTEYE